MLKKTKKLNIKTTLMMWAMKVEQASRIFFQVSIHRLKTILLHQPQTQTKNCKIKVPMLSNKMSSKRVYHKV